MKNLLTLLLIILLSAGSLKAQDLYQARASYVPAGTPINVSLNQTMSSEFTQVGETFTAGLAGPIYAGSSIIAPPGSQVQGQVVAVEPAGRTGKPGYMDMRLIAIITPDGRRIPLSATIDQNSFKLGAEGGRTSHFAKHTAVGAGAGALSGLIGASISGGKKGKAAAIGTGIGAGTGILAGAFRRGQEFVIRNGTVLPFRLDQAIQASPGAQVQQQSPSAGAFADPGYGSQYQQPQQQTYQAPSSYQTPQNYQAPPSYQAPAQASPYQYQQPPSYQAPPTYPSQPAAPVNPYLYD